MTQLLSMDRKRRGNALRTVCVFLTFTAFLAAVASANPASAQQVKASVSSANHGGHHAGSAKLRDPRRNVAAYPDFLANCAVNGSNNKRCLRESLAAIDNARAAEGLGAMILPKNYAKLSIPVQTFVVTNLERVDRGLRPFKGITAKLNANAHHAAVIRDDPTLIGVLLSLLGVREYASIWAGDFGPLASDYDWMYNDGYSSEGSVNLDCKTPSSKGCWGHRHAILGLFSGLKTLVAGVGTSKPIGASIAEILVGSVRSSFHYTYTWKRALAHGAAGHKVTA